MYIVGGKDPQYTKLLNKQVKNNNIYFHDAVDTQKANLFMNAADFCLLPVNNVRLSPGSPLKLYDYISCGKPVIAQSTMLGYSDEVERYDLGYTVDFTNTDMAANFLANELDVTKGKDFLANNRRVAETEVSWKQRMIQWLNFIYGI